MADLAAMINGISKAGIPSTSETILDAEETRAALLAMVGDAGSGLIAADALGEGSVSRSVADAISELIADLAASEYIEDTRRRLARQIAEIGGSPPTMASSPTMTAGAANAAATLTGTAVDKESDRFRDTGGAVLLGTGTPQSSYRTTQSLTFEDATRSGQLGAREFSTDCVAFEFRTLGQGNRYRIFVDGKLSTNEVALASDGSQYWIKVDFAGISGTPTLRHIRIEQNGGGRFGNVTPDSLGQIYAPHHAPGLRLCVLGDSFTEGVGATYSYLGYAPQLAKLLGFRDFVCSGFGGTGYITNNYPGYGSIRASLEDRIQADGVDAAADVYVIAMGINDPAGLQLPAIACIRALRYDRPGSLIYVLSPWSPSAPTAPTGAALTKLQEIQLAALRRIGVRFVDVSGLAYTKSDATHPDSAGHTTIAASLAATITADVEAIQATSRTPVSSSLPLLTGDFLDGETMHCSPGAWEGLPTSFAYQWQLDGEDIVDETASSYAVQVSDLTDDISCLVTATNAAGSTEASSAAQSALYGANILTNGDFSDGSTGWTVTGNWAVSAGIANHTTGAAGNLVKSYTNPGSAQIRISFVLSGYSANAVTLQNNGTNVRSYTANGTYSEILTTPVAGSPTVAFIAGTTFVGSIDNVQVRAVL